MKKIFGIALMFAVVAGGMTASAQNSNAPSQDKTEQCDRKDKKERKDNKCNKDNQDKKDRKDNKDRKEFKGKKDGQRMDQHKGQCPDLFAGITLSQEQQSKLDALNKAESKA